MGIGVGKPLWVSLNHFGCSTEGYVLFWRTAKLQACLDYLDWSMEKQVCLNLLQTVILRKRSNLQVCLSHLDWPMGGGGFLEQYAQPLESRQLQMGQCQQKIRMPSNMPMGFLNKTFLDFRSVRATWTGPRGRFPWIVCSALGIKATPDGPMPTENPYAVKYANGVP